MKFAMTAFLKRFMEKVGDVLKTGCVEFMLIVKVLGSACLPTSKEFNYILYFVLSGKMLLSGIF